MMSFHGLFTVVIATIPRTMYLSKKIITRLQLYKTQNIYRQYRLDQPKYPTNLTVLPLYSNFKEAMPET
jgi:hypothetical protein